MAKANKTLPPVDEWSERQTQIIEAALNVFAEKGFDGARTKEIAEAAGVSEALVFKHFKNKESFLDGLAALVVRRVVKPFFLQSVRALIEEKSGASIQEFYEAILTDRLGLLRKNQKLMGTFLLEAARRPALAKVLKDEMLTEIVGLFEETITPLKERGELPADLEVPVAVRSALGIIAGYVIGCEIAPELFGAPDDAREIPRLASVFLYGITGRGAKGGRNG
jgi:AcrR family transcriptional regulator